ncbi:hypothetical protein Aperf_G00000074381 [Anoplocephala perfoliata]
MPTIKELMTVSQNSNQNEAKESEGCFIIGISGGSGSGKTTLAENIIKRINHRGIFVLSMDSYYKDLSEGEKVLARKGCFNFDHPSSIDSDLLFEHFSLLKQGKSIDVPEYNFATHSHTGKTNTIHGASVIIFEGIMAFCYEELLKLMDLKIFVDTDSELRLARRLLRDIYHRGRKVEDVIRQYETFVKPAYDTFIAPTMSVADIIIPCGGANPVAIDLVVSGIEKRLNERSRQCSLLRRSRRSL